MLRDTLYGTDVGSVECEKKAEGMLMPKNVREEIKKEIAEFKEDLQRFEDEILDYYNEYDICYNGYDGKTRLGRKPQPLEDGIEEMLQYRRALEMLQSMSGSGESEECAEDDEQFEP